MRKEYLRGLSNRTPEQIAEEALYVEVKRLEANKRQLAKDREDLLKMPGGVESGLPNLSADWDRKPSKRTLEGMSSHGGGSFFASSMTPRRREQGRCGCRRRFFRIPRSQRITLMRIV
jgi:hypothetical protein